MPADWEEVRHLRSVQDGVFTRAQLHACGLTYADIQRLVRRRELTRVRPGVFLDHTGPQTWMQRAWIAVLACQPAALSHASVWRETSPIGAPKTPRWGRCRPRDTARNLLIAFGATG